eukprot:2290429-Rhodomonas_salina.1
MESEHEMHSMKAVAWKYKVIPSHCIMSTCILNPFAMPAKQTLYSHAQASEKNHTQPHRLVHWTNTEVFPSVEEEHRQTLEAIYSARYTDIAVNLHEKYANASHGSTLHDVPPSPNEILRAML